MPINRSLVDTVTKEPLSRRQQQRLATMLADYAASVAIPALEDDSIELMANESFSMGHTHVSTDMRACDTCVAHARDERQ